MTSFPSKTSQPYTPPNHSYPSPSYPSSQGPYSYTRPNLSSPSSFNPYPSLPGMSYPGSSSGYSTPFLTSGINQPTFSSQSTLSGPSFGNSSSPSFRPPSFESRMQQERMDRFNPSTGITPSWVTSPSLPSHLSSSYTRTNHNAGFSSPPLPTLDTSFLRYPTSMGSTPLSSSSLGISSFTPQPPSLSGRAYVASSSSQGTLPSSSFGITSFSPQPPSLSGRAHVPSLSGPQGTLPSRSYEITTWNPQSFSTERSPFIPSTFGKTSGSLSFPQYQPHFTSSFEKHIDLQRMLRLQFEEAIKTMYQVRPSPERPFPIWQTMGTTPFAIQIDPRTTVFVDPVTVTKFFQRASSDQQRAFRAQFDQLTSRREVFDPSEKRLSTTQQVNASQEGHAVSLSQAIAIMYSTDTHAMTKYVGIFLKNTLLTIEQLNGNPKRLSSKMNLSQAWETEAVPAMHRAIDNAYGTNLGASYNPNNDGRVQQFIQNAVLDPLWLVPMGHFVEGVNLTLRGATVTIQEINTAIKTTKIAVEMPGAIRPAYATAGSMMAKKTKAIEGAAVVQRSVATEDIAQHTAKGFFGKKGFELKFPNYQDSVRNADQIIKGRKYIGHALDQMQNRGIPPSAVENAIEKGIRTPDPIPGRLQCHDPINKITVIIEEATGNVITTVGK